jgi:hypothetical protein
LIFRKSFMFNEFLLDTTSMGNKRKMSTGNMKWNQFVPVVIKGVIAIDVRPVRFSHFLASQTGNTCS